MNSYFLVAGFVSVLLFMKTVDSSSGAGPAGLVAPVPGIPLSAEQMEERTRKLPDGTLEVEKVKSRTFRDATGRLRTEEQTAEPAPDHPALVLLFDPTTSTKVVLITQEKMALRSIGPKVGESGFPSGVGSGIGDGLPSGKWNVRTEKLGKRVIEGLEVEGTRITHTREGQGTVERVEERWYSSELKLVVLAVASGPNGTHKAEIRHLVRGDPNPERFTIPPEYEIQDVPLSEQ